MMSLGARLEARFRPNLFWGAEFLAAKVRLCALGVKEGLPFSAHTFSGDYAGAEAFAAQHGIGLQGLHAAVSHLPFKVESLGNGSEHAEEDLTPYAERMRPQGMPLDAFDLQTFSLGGERQLVMAREDVLRAFLETLPASLSGLESLDAAPLAIATLMDMAGNRGWSAAILAEANFCHVLFLQDENLRAYAKVFHGWEEARANSVSFQREIKKALVYHFSSRFPDAKLASVQIWRDGSDGELSASIKGLGIPQVTPPWPKALQGIPEEFRVAAGMALRGMYPNDMAMSFSIPRPEAVENRRLWRRRSGQLAKTGYHVLAGAAIGVVLLVLSALAMRWTVEAKARTWSGELGKWDEYQKRKAAVELQLGGMQDLLARRTQGYAAMQSIAAALPPEVWLETWEMEPGPTRGLVHRLSGLTLAEKRIPEILSNLEKVKKIGSVKLKSTERLKGETVEQKTGIHANRKDLVRFTIGISE